MYKSSLTKVAATMLFLTAFVAIGHADFFEDFARSWAKSAVEQIANQNSTRACETPRPNVDIVSPTTDAHYAWGDPITIRVKPWARTGIRKVEFSTQGGRSFTAYDSPWEWNLSIGNRNWTGAQWYCVYATAYDNNGNSSTTSIHIRVGKEY